MPRRTQRALVYGDVNLNLIDGSAIWAQGIVQALAAAGCEVTLLLKSPVRTSRLIDPLLELPTVTVRRPHEERLLDGLGGSGSGAGLTDAQAGQLLRRLDAEEGYDLVVLRGWRVAAHAAGDETLHGRLWTYLTDFPQSAGELSEDSVAELTRIAEASRFLLCQTEELRCFLEAAVPAACGKGVLLPPVVPAPDFEVPQRSAPGEPVRLVYTGKFAPRWNTHEMTTLPDALATRGVRAEMHMIGDKVHDDPADSGFAERMRAGLRRGQGVVWHGGHPRQQAMRLSSQCDVGLSWRHPDLDASLELSTKVLEFGALGLPVLLNRTPMHEELLGVDYPFFVSSDADPTADVADVVEAAVRAPEIYELAASRCRAAAQRFGLDEAARRLRGYLDRAFPSAPELARGLRPLRVGVASHDLKFFSRLLDHLRGLPEIEVGLDRWPALSQHDVAASQEMVEWADVIICEWCGPNAVWYSRHRRRDQRLLVRLHRFELYGPWPAQVDIDAVDQVICVSPYYARLTRERTGWPADRVVVAPNWVDDEQLDRPKLEGAQFHLGFIGVAPARKRVDLALDVLAELRRHDPRFMLFTKTKMPWDYWWIWKNDTERDYFQDVLRTVQSRPELRDAVVFDPFGPDIGAWLRRVGFVLSTSDDESFHLAPAEGMAAGAVPALLNWPGADTIYDDRWVHAGPAEMAEAIAATVREGRWEADRTFARDQVRQAFGLDRVCRLWTRLLTENLPPATAQGNLSTDSAHA